MHIGGRTSLDPLSTKNTTYVDGFPYSQGIEYLKTSPVWPEFQALSTLEDKLACIISMVNTHKE